MTAPTTPPCTECGTPIEVVGYRMCMACREVGRRYSQAQRDRAKAGRKRVKVATAQKRAAVMALAGTMTRRDVAAVVGISESTVASILRKWSGVNGAQVAEIRKSLPDQMTVLAAGHAQKALESLETDPALAVKSTFGAKLALESVTLARPQAAQPGVQVLAFVQNLIQATPAPVPEAEAVDVTAERSEADG